ncbi:AGAP013186-PA-like protein [Anopheles sinensis]|uniref:AGAP013186-PA-like protein n=1 Tax=Anopheles sinensis TaxID=74873 RepID=A0A084VW29_ANOSI|nr:AGAP013186-PA-like protein [Anopheles sinensis]
MDQNDYAHHLSITVYDTVLHSNILRNPTSVQISNNHIGELHMPTDLQMGEFQHNWISVVHTNSSLSYKVTYLDLMYNSIADISNFSALISLQTLILEGNIIEKVNGTTFSGMHNLSVLYLGANHILDLDFKGFPKALTKLWLFKNYLTDLELDDVSMPALNVLDLRRNSLTTIDSAAVFTAFPGLEILQIEFNQFQENEAKRIITELNQYNLSHSNGMKKPNCASGEIVVSKFCFSVSLLIWKGLALLLLGVILVGMFVFSMHRIWYEIPY